MKFFSQPQKGSALLQAMFAVSAVTFGVSMTMQLQNSYQEQLQQDRKRQKRDEIGKNLLNQLIKPTTINASANVFGIDNPGNQKLYACVGYDKLNAAGETKSLPTCDPKENRDVGTEFVLRPDTSYSFPEQKLKNTANCPDTKVGTSISCFLAGTNQRKTVGYNFNGDSGNFSADFPLEARAFFKPICPKPSDILEQESGKCHFAEVILLRIELSHWMFDKAGKKMKQKSFLGTFPKSLYWNQMSVADLLGSQCNEGAVMFSDDRGVMLCRCHAPYRYTGNNNPRGELCELDMPVCPSSQVLVGREANGKAICQELSSKDMLTWTEKIDATKNIVTADCFDQDGVQRGGWATSIKQRCKSLFETVESEHPDSPDIKSMIAGGLIGFLIVLMVALIHMLIIVSTGNIFGGIMLTGYLAFIGLTIVGAALGYVMGLSWDWSIVSKDVDKPTPEVQCTYEVECRAFKQPEDFN